MFFVPVPSGPHVYIGGLVEFERIRGGELVKDSDIIRAMPKAEVHLHLEGTISPETLWSLAERNGVMLPVSSLEELRGLYAFEDFGTFIKLWLLMCSCLKTEADYLGMVDGFVAECRRQNIRYAELHFTPYNHERFGMERSAPSRS